MGFEVFTTIEIVALKTVTAGSSELLVCHIPDYMAP
jgi:hypothetical protein